MIFLCSRLTFRPNMKFVSLVSKNVSLMMVVLHLEHYIFDGGSCGLAELDLCEVPTNIAVENNNCLQIHL